MGRRVFDSRSFLLSDWAIRQSARSIVAVQGQPFRRAGREPHRAGSRECAAGFGSRSAALAARRASAISANRAFAGGPHAMSDQRGSLPPIYRSAVLFGLAALVALVLQLNGLAQQNTAK